MNNALNDIFLTEDLSVFIGWYLEWMCALYGGLGICLIVLVAEDVMLK